jgi:hypothetical protein
VRCKELLQTANCKETPRSANYRDRACTYTHAMDFVRFRKRIALHDSPVGVLEGRRA